MNRLRLAGTIFIMLLMATACSNVEKDWDIAQRDDTPEAFLEFLAKHPNSKYIDEARQRVAQLKILRAWERAEFRNTEVAYRDFLDRYPNSEHASTAEQWLHEFEREVAWESAQDSLSSRVAAAFIRDYPDAPQIAQAKTLLATRVQGETQTPEQPVEPDGDYRLQLGSLRTAQAAESELRRLVELFPDTIDSPIRIEAPSSSTAAPLFVLKTVPMSQAIAEQRCNALKSYGQTCLIVGR